MRKPAAFIAIVGALSLTILSAASWALKNPAAPEIPESATAPVSQPAVTPSSTPVSASPEPEAVYWVRAQDGLIQVFLPNSPDLPALVTDISVARLRRYDQDMLCDGIEVTGHENLLHLLESFCP